MLNALIAVVCMVSPPSHKVVLLAWDGAPAWIVNRMVEQGKLPNLARLEREGASVSGLRAAYPSNTAASFASIFTGTWPSVHGIVGNSVPVMPRAEHTFLETASGFSSESLQAEPVFVTAARQGKNVVVLGGTQSFPPEKYLRTLGPEAKHYRSFSGFETEIAKPEMHDFSTKIVPLGAYTDLPPGNGPYREITFKVADTPIYVLAYNDPKDPVQGYDTLLIRPNSRQLGAAKMQTIIKPKPATSEDDRAWSAPIRVQKGDLYGYVSFRLWKLSPDLESCELYQSKVSMIRGSGDPAETAAYSAASRGFHDDPFKSSYAEGLLGKTLYQGGSGEAEARAVEIVRRDVENAKHAIRFALGRWKPDLLTQYSPMVDSAGHTWMGVLDPDSPAYNAELAAKLMPHYETVIRMMDESLGDAMAIAKDYNFVVVSDHGMQGTSKLFCPNAVLEKAGLLTRTFGNAVEPAQTKIAATPWSEFFLVINGIEWKGGIVRASDRDSLLEEVRLRMLAVRDPDTGEQVVTKVYRTEELPEYGVGGLSGGDLYLELQPGYAWSSRISANPVVLSNSPIGSGTHGFHPARPKMQAILYLWGPNVTPQTRIAQALQIDVAPTIAAILGIKPSEQAQGHVLPGVRN